MSLQYGELRPLATEIGSVVWGTTPANFNGFRVFWQRYSRYTARHSISERQPNFAALNRAFGRAAITLSIGPHSSSCIFLSAIAIDRYDMFACELESAPGLQF